MVTIRKARREDAQAAWDIRNAAINSQCVGHYSAEALAIWTAGEISEQFMTVVEHHFYVATIDDLIVGTGMVNLASGKVDAIFVHPSHMGMGVGKKLIAHLESLARSVGLTQLHLESTLNAAPVLPCMWVYRGESRSISVSQRVFLGLHPHDQESVICLTKRSTRTNVPLRSPCAGERQRSVAGRRTTNEARSDHRCRRPPGDVAFRICCAEVVVDHGHRDGQ
jgi:GNAT superfamily N-acetyltransferase